MLSYALLRLSVALGISAAFVSHVSAQMQASVSATAPSEIRHRAEAIWSYSLENYDLTYLVPAFTFVLHEITYFAAYLPYFIADFIPFLQKYKIQPNRSNTKELQMNCFWRLMFLHYFVELPLICATYPAMQLFGVDLGKQLPTLSNVACFIFASIVVEDFYFYWVHRLLHTKKFYWIHKIHHEHAAPFGITAEYAHPIETIFLGIGTGLGPVIFAPWIHIVHLWAWLLVRVNQTVEVHSGYDFPWSLNNWIPFWGGAEFHDFHHNKNIGNYASTFTYMDAIFGTDRWYHKYNAQKAKAAKAE